MTDASFPFQAKDWQSSEAVRLMSLAERGAFIGLLAASWVAGGEYPCTIPDNDRAIATLLGVSLREWKTVAKAVRNQFESAPNSRLRNARLYGEWVALQQRRKAKSEGGSRGAARRWHPSAPPAVPSKSDDSAYGIPNGYPNGIANGIAIGSANGSAIRAVRRKRVGGGKGGDCVVPGSTPGSTPGTTLSLPGTTTATTKTKALSALGADTIPAWIYDRLRDAWTTRFGPVGVATFRALCKPALTGGVRPGQLVRAMVAYRHEADATRAKVKFAWFLEDVRRWVREGEACAVDIMPAIAFGMTDEEAEVFRAEHQARLAAQDAQEWQPELSIAS